MILFIFKLSRETEILVAVSGILINIGKMSLLHWRKLCKICSLTMLTCTLYVKLLCLTYFLPVKIST